MTKLERYQSILADEGFRPEINTYGNIVFKFEGHRFVIVPYEDDDEYVCLMYPSLWNVRGDMERRRAVNCANTTTREKKVVKVFLEENERYVSATIEMYLVELDNLRPVLMRCLHTLLAAGRDFTALMRRSEQELHAAAYRRLARHRLVEVLSEGDFGHLDEIVAATYSMTDPATPPDGWPAGPEGLRELAQVYRAAFENLRFTVKRQVVEGDVVATIWHADGIQRGAFLGAPASNRSVTFTGAAFDRVADGRIVETWTSFDSAVLFRAGNPTMMR